MKKQYMIGEKNGKKYVAHTDNPAVLDGAMEITKAEYRRHRTSGIPSWGEEQTAKARAQARNPKRAARWAVRAEVARQAALKMEQERMRDWRARQAKAQATV